MIVLYFICFVIFIIFICVYLSKVDTSIFDYRRVSKKYYHYNDNNINYLFDKNNKTCYDIKTNKFLDYYSNCDNLLVQYRRNYFKKITEDEYLNLFKNYICNCKVGDGSDIHVSKVYDFKKEYNKLDKKYKIGSYTAPYYSSNIYISSEDDNRSLFSVFLDGDFCKKACVACGTCLDEYDIMIDYIDKKIKEKEDKIKEKELRNKMVEDICQKII